MQNNTVSFLYGFYILQKTKQNKNKKSIFIVGNVMKDSDFGDKICLSQRDAQRKDFNVHFLSLQPLLEHGFKSQ